MPTFQQYINKINPDLDVNKKGSIVDPGPYEAIVKNNNDSRRTGRMDVYIASLGGIPDDPRSWIPVKYMSPFLGTTDQGLLDKQEQTAMYSYGMWLTLPDPGSKVVVVFLEGQRNNGVIIGSVVDDVANHMTPGLASSKKWLKTEEVTTLFPTLEPDTDFLPVTEFNTKVVRDSRQTNTIYRPVNIELAKILKAQGLIGDNIRGQSFSTPQRENNSQVFGLSTPGRGDKDPASDPALKTKMQNGEATAEDLQIRKRFPGHSLVLDDGDSEGASKLVRLRTSTGHQILMDDTNNLIYIATNNGNAWIEMSEHGKIDIHSEDSISIHTAKNINMTAEKSINLEAGEKVNIKSMVDINLDTNNINTMAQGDTKITSGATSHINSGTSHLETATAIHMNGGTAASQAARIPTNNVPTVKLEEKEWIAGPPKNYISKRVPQHEPWTVHEDTTPGADDS
tara:strand:- start:43864 stop:45222 length:1359 start_codon:yes stop_codon:yes gene_type:complete